MITIKSASELVKMQAAGKVVGETLKLLGENVRPGLFLGSLTKPQPHSCLEQRFLISDTMCQTRGTEWFYDTVLAKETQGKVWTGWGNSGKE